jgi:hypothetical protein
MDQSRFQHTSQLLLLSVLCRIRIIILWFRATACERTVSTAAKSPAKLVNSPGRGKTGQKGGEIPHPLTPRQLQSTDKRILKAIGCIGIVAKQAVRCLPYGRTMFFDNRFPVNYLQIKLLLSNHRQSNSRSSFLFYYINY